MKGSKVELVIEAECRDSEISFGTLGRAPCSPEALERIVKTLLSAVEFAKPPGIRLRVRGATRSPPRSPSS